MRRREAFGERGSMFRENILEINDLTVSFRSPGGKASQRDHQGELVAVKGASLSLAMGETLALVGESGCGKTVLCKSALKLLCEKGGIRGGEILFDGKDLVPLSQRDMREYRGRDVAMVFQDPATALDPAFSVGEQIAEVLRLHKNMSRKEAQRRAVALMEMVQIPDASARYHRRPYQFSGGMRQRIVIAMALAGEPRLLIADEPTTALDEETQQEILKLLKDMQQKTGAAILFITHDLSLVEEMAEQVAIMKDGVIVEKGPVKTVFSTPQHPYTRKLRGYLDYKKGRGHTHRSMACGQVAERRGAYERRRILSVENLSKSFDIGGLGETRALEDFSMELHTGEIVGLVGKSGCGKTTLARCIMGIEKAESGQISTGSIDREPNDKSINIQMIFQDSSTAFNDRMTVREIIAEPLIVLGKLGRRPARGGGGSKSLVGGGVSYTKDKRSIAESIRTAMQAVELDYEYFADRKPYELSGGQRQRVAIARALITDPDIIIADEPLTGLDVTAQAQIAHLFRKLSDERGLAVLFIAHDLPMVEHISDRVIRMGASGCQAAGSQHHRATES